MCVVVLVVLEKNLCVNELFHEKRMFSLYRRNDGWDRDFFSLCFLYFRGLVLHA